MKKLITILMMLLIAVPALAVESEVKPGIVPGSSLYGLDVWFDELSVKMAKTPLEKAQKRLEIAEERTAEIEKVSKENKIQEMEEAREQHRIQMEEIESLSNEIPEDKLVALQQRFQKHIMNLERVRAQVPEQAYAGIDRAIENANSNFNKNQIKISVQNRESVETMQQKIESGTITIKEGQVLKDRSHTITSQEQADQETEE